MAVSLYDLFQNDPQAMQRAATKVEAVISAVGETHPSPTGQETRRRVQVCAEHIRMCTNELEWSLTRALGTMHAKLVCVLEGVDWVPDEGTTSVVR